VAGVIGPARVLLVDDDALVRAATQPMVIRLIHRSA
jgi:hypothetical protein